MEILGETINHAATIHSCTVSSVLNNITPYVSLIEKVPDNPKLRVFGCVAYVHVEKKVRKSKLDNRTQLVIYLGTVHGLYRVYLLSKKKVVHKKDATVDEESVTTGMKANKILLGYEIEIPH